MATVAGIFLVEQQQEDKHTYGHYHNFISRHEG
jgi:hypothetical protein